MKAVRHSKAENLRSSNEIPEYKSQRRSIIANTQIQNRTSISSQQEQGFFAFWYAKIYSGLFGCCSTNNNPESVTLHLSSNNLQSNGSFAYSFVVKDKNDPNFESAGRERRYLSPHELFTIKDFDENSFIEIVPIRALDSRFDEFSQHKAEMIDNLEVLEIELPKSKS